MQRASRAASRRDCSELIEAEPAEQRQTERDPEREPAVIGDFEHGQARSRLSTGGQRNAPMHPKTHEPGQKRDVRLAPRTTTASGASQIKVARPA